MDCFVRLRMLSTLPIQFQCYLHLPRGVGLAGDHAEGGCCSGSWRALEKTVRFNRLNASQRKSTRLPSRITKLFAMLMFSLKVGKRAHLRVVTGRVAEDVAGLRGKDAFVQEQIH